MNKVKKAMIVVNTLLNCVKYRNRTFTFEGTKANIKDRTLDNIMLMVDYDYKIINKLEKTPEFIKGLEFMTQLPISLVDPAIYEYEISGDYNAFRNFAKKIVSACMDYYGTWLDDEKDMVLNYSSNERLYTTMMYYAGVSELQDTIIFTICDME